MASHGHVAVDLPTHVIVRVDHGVADSFSRSVMPTATRTWRRAMHCGANRHRVGALAPDFTVDRERGRCASFTAFGPSFPAAEKALADYLALIQGFTTTE